MYLNQSIVQLWQKYKNIKRKARAGLLIQSINFSKEKPLSGSSYIKLPKVLDHPRKGLINIKNIDHSEFLKWSLVRYRPSCSKNYKNIYIGLISKT